MVRMNCLFLAKWEKNRTPKGPAKSEYAVLIDSMISVKMRIISVYIKKPDQCERRFCTLQWQCLHWEVCVLCYSLGDYRPWDKLTLLKIPCLSDPALSAARCHNFPASTGGVPCASHASRMPTRMRAHNKNTTGNLSNESCWSSAGLKSNGAKRVVQSGELSWLEEHVVQ